MKKLICSTCLLFITLSNVQAQSLQKTRWKSFFAAPINDTATLTINRDTSIISSSKGIELVRSNFRVSHDTVSISDIGGPIACLDEPALYKISNSGTVLKLTIISDPCDGRANSLSGREWIKLE
jgi:hypothetical protein